LHPSVEDHLIDLRGSMGQPPFAVTGKVNKITLSIDRPKVTPEDETKPTQATRNNKVSQ